MGQSVTYPDPVCAVTGSDVTLPCTFTAVQTPPGSSSDLEVVRVRWCQNHEICHGTVPSVYDSRNQRNLNHPRYRYLGDLKGNCTLQIRDVQKEDDAVLRFRMEANDVSGHFTGRSGVKVTVIGKSSSSRRTRSSLLLTHLFRRGRGPEGQQLRLRPPHRHSDLHLSLRPGSPGGHLVQR